MHAPYPVRALAPQHAQKPCIQPRSILYIASHHMLYDIFSCTFLANS